MAIFSPYNTQFGFSEESTFGTAIADGGTFTTLIEGEPPSLDPGLVEDRETKYRDQPYADKNDSFVSESGGLRVISMPEHTVRRIDLSPLLYSVTQTVTEAVGSPFQKDFTISNTFTQPDFSSNAGYFVTLGINDVVASNHRKFTSCVLRSLTLSADITGDGRLKASGEWISGFANDTTANFSGTWAPTAQNYYNFAAPTTKTLGASNILMSAFDLTINNNIERAGNDSSGQAENYSAMHFEITGNITCMYDANTDGFLADWIAGTSRALVLSVGTDSAAGFFQIRLPQIEFTGNENDYSNQAGRMVSLPFKAMGDTSSNELADFEVEDGNDFTW